MTGGCSPSRSSRSLSPVTIKSTSLARASAIRYSSFGLVFTSPAGDERKDGGDDLADSVRARRDLIFHVPSSSQIVAQAVGRLGTWVQSENYKPHVLADFMDSADPYPRRLPPLGVNYENTFQMMRALGARFS